MSEGPEQEPSILTFLAWLFGAGTALIGLMQLNLRLPDYLQERGICYHSGYSPRTSQSYCSDAYEAGLAAVAAALCIGWLVRRHRRGEYGDPRLDHGNRLLWVAAAATSLLATWLALPVGGGRVVLVLTVAALLALAYQRARAHYVETPWELVRQLWSSKRRRRRYASGMDGWAGLPDAGSDGWGGDGGCADGGGGGGGDGGSCD